MQSSSSQLYISMAALANELWAFNITPGFHEVCCLQIVQLTEAWLNEFCLCSTVALSTIFSVSASPFAYYVPKIC